MIPKLLIKSGLSLAAGFTLLLILTLSHPYPLPIPSHQLNHFMSILVSDWLIFNFQPDFCLVCFTHPVSSRVTLPMNLVVLSLYNSPAFADDSLSIPKH